MSDREPPLAGQRYAWTNFGETYGDADRTFTPDMAAANLITSVVAGGPDNATHGQHKVVIDVDLPISVIESSTPGHFHLFIDKAMDWPTYVALLEALVLAGIVEVGYLAAALSRGHTAVRLPWVRKSDTVGSEP